MAISSNCCTTSTSTSAVFNANTISSGTTLKTNGGNWITTTTPITTDSWTITYPAFATQDKVNELEKEVEVLKNIIKKINKKEKPKMFEGLTKNLKCGRAQDVRLSIYGPAFKGEDGNWYSVDTDGEMTDVSDLLFDMDSYCYMMPVAKNAINEGDFILHNGHWIKVLDYENGCIMNAVDTFTKQFVTPTVTKSPFGFEFYTKLIQLLDFSKMPISTENPFGMVPMMLMMNNKEDKDLLPILMMMGMQNGEFKFDMSNPMMMYLMMKDSNSSDILPYMMMGTFKSATQV